jgi:hypothetical protein
MNAGESTSQAGEMVQSAVRKCESSLFLKTGVVKNAFGSMSF